MTDPEALPGWAFDYFAATDCTSWSRAAADAARGKRVAVIASDDGTVHLEYRGQEHRRATDVRALDQRPVARSPYVHMDAHVHFSPGAFAHASMGLLLGVAVLAAVDGVYIHLIRLKLYARAESWSEHGLHTVRTMLFLPATYALFGVVSGGPLLWAGITLAMIDQVVEMFDMASEKESRAGVGGLSSFEYILHGMLTLLRSAAIALLLASRPVSAFSWSAPSVIAQLDEPYGWLVRQLYPGAAVLALVHVWLACRHCPWRMCRTT